MGIQVGASTEAKKAEWIAALRCGAFQQHRGSWCGGPAMAPTSFCCLGLAGQILGYGYAAYDNIAVDLDMSEAVQKRLIEMNDRSKKSFAEIADWIETHDLKTGEPLSKATGGEA